MFVTAKSFVYFTTMHLTAFLPVIFNTFQWIQYNTGPFWGTSASYGQQQPTIANSIAEYISFQRKAAVYGHDLQGKEHC